MRKLCPLLLFFSPLVLAQEVRVETNSFMRLPNATSSLVLERLDVADFATLLVPANVTELKVEDLHLGREARIAIVPTGQSLHLVIQRAQLDEGSQFTSRGAPGTYEKTAKPGRNLNLRIESLQAQELSVDARGGTGAPGYVGLDGANGDEPGCTWGQAGRGADGDNGGNGHPGAAGGQVRLELPRDFPDEQIKVWVDGGAGGLAGAGGKPGAGGKSKGCLVYRADGGKGGRPGAQGEPGPEGVAGSLTVQRL
ncbi:collagen-like protein [Pseudomonas piscis]|uniref:Collagen-like protein n=1 Tax=Pseudomonas piscis TaxID=2614538 RepID=A0A7X1U379_9PSED|nr:collagen-like protein [Pseudomonas piscis]MQA52680.1 collagen-like protein [Pseudomonas piscis]